MGTACGSSSLIRRPAMTNSLEIEDASVVAGMGSVSA